MNDAITNFILSPPGGLVAGGVLGGLVWKFLGGLDNVLNDDTKLQVAVWLRDANPERPAEAARKVLLSGFDRAFGDRQLSWRCGLSSIVLTVCLTALGLVKVRHTIMVGQLPLSQTALAFALMLVLPVFWSVYCLRQGVRKITATSTLLRMIGYYLLACLQSAFSLSLLGIALVAVPMLLRYPSMLSQSEVGFLVAHTAALVGLLFALVVPGVLTVFLVSAYGLKASIRLHKYLGSFNRHMDIEKKPFLSIGEIAGPLVAVLYWAWIIMSQVVG
jgi:hypothetical protein